MSQLNPKDWFNLILNIYYVLCKKFSKLLKKGKVKFITYEDDRQGSSRKFVSQ